MLDSLLETKFRRPRLRPTVVNRPRLTRLLDRGAEAPVTLVSAPAGFGKTTMVVGWLAAREAGAHVAWVSLDESDQDVSTFWTYVLLSIDRAVPGSGQGPLSQLQRGSAAVEAAVVVVLNELSVIRDDLILVLDDYHLAESPAIQPGMRFLVEHLPPQVHLLISSRVDPALPLSRLRARGDLVEIRAADLRFTGDEASTYLNGAHNLDLAPDDVATLEDRTEGWAAALQLAALSLRNRADPSRFIAGFAGEDRFVVDYLADEVLDRQPPEVRRFLLETAVLERLTAPLCDALTGRSNGRTMLETLERQNLFLVPLDDIRQWYRYHHLFADVLRARLLHERRVEHRVADQATAADLHRRASDWFQEAGDHEAAVRHALAAGDLDLAAARIELAIPRLRRERREMVTLHWVDALPAEVIENRPVLASGLVGALMASNQFTGVEERLLEVERMLAGPPDLLVVVDRDELARLPATVETHRAGLSLVRGDPADAIVHAEQAVARASHDDLLTLAAASALLGLARWGLGDLDAALTAYRNAADHLERAEHLADVLGCSITIAELQIALGQLSAAQRTFDHARDLAARHTDPPLRGSADAYVGLARVAWEHGDLAQAAEHLLRADELGETAGLPQNPYRWRVGLARIRAAAGDTSSALDLLAEAERVYAGDFNPDVQPVQATRAQVLVAAGSIDEAYRWAHQHGLNATDEMTYLREYEHLTLARVLLADHLSSGAPSALAASASLLDRLQTAAHDGGRIRTLTEALTLRSLAHEAAGQRDAALAALGGAARLAEPQRFVTAITASALMPHAPLLDLLRSLTTRHPDWGFLRHLLATVAPPPPTGTSRVPDHTADTTAIGHAPTEVVPPVEPLSAREMEVLRLLGSDLTGPDIARELGVSLTTVRTHTQHIYTKLGVTSRRAAVRRAHHLGHFTSPLRG